MLNNIGLLFLRGTFGLLMLVHGWGKLIDFTAKSASFPDPIGLGSQFALTLTVFSEFFCALFVIAGLLTRWVSIPLIITMLVAWYMHGVAWGDPWGKQEKAVLFLCAYTAIAMLGPGDWSLDRILLKKKS